MPITLTNLQTREKLNGFCFSQFCIEDQNVTRPVGKVPGVALGQLQDVVGQARRTRALQVQHLGKWVLRD